MFLEFLTQIRDEVIPAVIGWAVRLYNEIGDALPYILAIFFIMLATRFFIMPLIAGKLFSAGSDGARNSNSRDRGRNSTEIARRDDL